MTHIKKPSVITVEGNKPKLIEEFIGRVNSNTKELSIARMNSSEGWTEPAQCPEFNEYTIVLKGRLHVKTINEEIHVNAGEAYIAKKGVEVQYSTPGKGGAEYIAVCVPAFSADTVHRKE